jgi:hypothetical protein
MDFILELVPWFLAGIALALIVAIFRVVFYFIRQLFKLVF